MPDARTSHAAQPPDAGSDARRAYDAGVSLAIVLDEVRFGRSRSRLELAERTGLSRAVVTQRVGELIERGLLTEHGTEPSTGGRPPRRLRFQASAGHLLVADLGATSIDVARTDLAGTILEHLAEPADIADGPDVILDRVDGLFGRLLDGAGPAAGPPSGIGIGLPGPVEFGTGRPVSPPIMPGWDRYPVRERMSARFGVPVWVDNDANVMALGEWRHGVAQGHQHVVFVKIGSGIGAGLISDGKLHRGAQGSAGDVGHIQVSDDPGSICRCGNIGCLEALAGGAALAREATRAATDGRSPFLAEAFARSGAVTAVDVAEAAARGDAFAVELIQRAGERVGRMLASVVNVFNPSQIVIGGGVAGAGDGLLAAIRQAIYGRSLPLATRDLLIQRSSLGSIAGVTGAAAMVLDELFAASRVDDWKATPDPAAASTSDRVAVGG